MTGPRELGPIAMTRPQRARPRDLCRYDDERGLRILPSNNG